jgi:Polysaccharide pyruvyl transferase
LRTGIYIGWTGYSNLGDEAMLEVCQSRLAQYRWVPFDLWNAQPRPTHFARNVWRSPSTLLRSLRDELRTRRRLRGFVRAREAGLNLGGAPPVALLGGGTLINSTREFLQQYKIVRQRLGHAPPVFSCGVKTPDFFAGKGDWRDLSREWVEATSELPVVGVRGPLSKEYLDAAGARNVAVAGDPAVWLHGPLKDSLRAYGSRRRKIGVNCGTAQFIWGDLSRLLSTQAEIVRTLVASGHEVELFAVCPEDVSACIEVARQAHAGIAPNTEPLTTYKSFIAKLETFDLVVALKLHAGVLAACGNVPFIMLEYQPKCRDFCASIGWEDYNVRTDRGDANSILQLSEALLLDLPSSRRLLCQRMCELRDRFQSYCVELEKMLSLPDVFLDHSPTHTGYDLA